MTMLKVQCVGCNKTYNIDFDKAPGDEVEFPCSACKTTVVGKRSEAGKKVKIKKSKVKKETAADAPKRGMTVRTKLIAAFLSMMIVTGGALAGVYLNTVPDMMRTQINMRSTAVAKVFGSGINDSILTKNYLRVNQNAEQLASLPGIAYVGVLNNRGAIAAGMIGQKDRYSKEFMKKVEETGFPVEVLTANKPLKGDAEKSLTQVIDKSVEVVDVAVPIGETGWEAHVAVFTADIRDAVNKTLYPLVTILGAMLVLGGIGIMLLAYTVSRPIRMLSEAANKMALGDTETTIKTTGSGEIAELSESLELMRVSISKAMERLRRH